MRLPCKDLEGFLINLFRARSELVRRGAVDEAAVRVVVRRVVADLEVLAQTDRLRRLAVGQVLESPAQCHALEAAVGAWQVERLECLDVLRVAVKIYPKRVYLEVEPGRTGAELELWSLRKEAGYFREVFGRELFATLT